MPSWSGLQRSPRDIAEPRRRLLARRGGARRPPAAPARLASGQPADRAPERIAEAYGAACRADSRPSSPATSMSSPTATA